MEGGRHSLGDVLSSTTHLKGGILQRQHQQQHNKSQCESVWMSSVATYNVAL